MTDRIGEGKVLRITRTITTETVVKFDAEHYSTEDFPDIFAAAQYERDQDEEQQWEFLENSWADGGGNVTTYVEVDES